jgi:hypothetical protein
MLFGPRGAGTRCNPKKANDILSFVCTHARGPYEGQTLIAINRSLNCCV